MPTPLLKDSQAMLAYQSLDGKVDTIGKQVQDLRSAVDAKVDTIGRQVQDLHSAVVGNEKYGQLGLISRIGVVETNMASMIHGEKIEKRFSCVEKEIRRHRLAIAGITSAAATLWALISLIWKK